MEPGASPKDAKHQPYGPHALKYCSTSLTPYPDSIPKLPPHPPGSPYYPAPPVFGNDDFRTKVKNAGPYQHTSRCRVMINCR